MKRILYYDYIALLCVGMGMIAACVKEESVRYELPKANTLLKIPMTRGPIDDTNEGKVKTARIVATRLNGEVVANEFRSPLAGENDTVNVFVPTGLLNLYLIANERAVWKLGNSGLTATALKQKNYAFYDEYAGSTLAKVNDSIPAFGKYENVLVDETGHLKQNASPLDLIAAPSTVRRILSKVTLKLRCKYSELANGGDPIEVSRIQIKRIPKTAALDDSKPYAGAATDFFDSEPAAESYAPRPADEVNDPGLFPGFSDSSVFYIPEYIVADPALHTYLSIRVHLTEDSTKTGEYRIPLGEGLKQGYEYMKDVEARTASDFTIFRNTHFRIDAKITSFDQAGIHHSGIQVSLKVNRWEETGANDPIEIGDYRLNVDQSAIRIRKDSYPYYGVLGVGTDHPKGWAAKVTAGSSLLSLRPEGSTDYDRTEITGQFSGRLYFKVEDPGSAGATATMLITAGAITKTVTVTAY